jgi:transcription initiation factor TFIIB
MTTNATIEADIFLHIKRQKEKRNHCSSCHTLLNNDQTSDGFLVCTQCGLVKEMCIDMNAEWRCFHSSNGIKETVVRCGTPTFTLMGTEPPLNTYYRGNDKRLHRVHQWINVSAKERILHQVYKDYEQIGLTYDLSKDIVTTATELYNKLHTEMEQRNCGVKRCSVKQGLKAACLYFACKQTDAPRERREIATMFGNSTRIITKGCNSFLNIMKGDYIYMEPFKPQDFVTRYSQAMGLPFAYQLKLLKIVNYVSKLEILADKSPTCITSACIYFLSTCLNLGYTKQTISDKCGISQSTMLKIYNNLIPHKDELCNLID